MYSLTILDLTGPNPVQIIRKSPKMHEVCFWNVFKLQFLFMPKKVYDKQILSERNIFAQQNFGACIQWTTVTAIQRISTGSLEYRLARPYWWHEMFVFRRNVRASGGPVAGGTHASVPRHEANHSQPPWQANRLFSSQTTKQHALIFISFSFYQFKMLCQDEIEKLAYKCFT